MKTLPVLFCLAATALYISCERDMTVEIKANDKRLLVEGNFTDELMVHSIKLHRSGSLITGHSQQTVSGAAIYITDRVDTFYYAECDTAAGLYRTVTECCGRPGTTYHLSIAHVDIDGDGETEEYTAAGAMPVPVEFEDLKTAESLNGDGAMGVKYTGYYKIKDDNNPAYIYPYILINGKVTKWGTMGENLGTMGFGNNLVKQPKLSSTEKEIQRSISFYIVADIFPGDSMCFVGLNFTQAQFNFLNEFDSNTNSDEAFQENAYDLLRIPSNLSTNIEPADRAAGFFFIYPVSKIAAIYQE